MEVRLNIDTVIDDLKRKFMNVGIVNHYGLQRCISTDRNFIYSLYDAGFNTADVDRVRRALFNDHAEKYYLTDQAIFNWLLENVVDNDFSRNNLVAHAIRVRRAIEDYTMAADSTAGARSLIQLDMYIFNVMNTSPSLETAVKMLKMDGVPNSLIVGSDVDSVLRIPVVQRYIRGENLYARPCMLKDHHTIHGVTRNTKRVLRKYGFTCIRDVIVWGRDKSMDTTIAEYLIGITDKQRKVLDEFILYGIMR